ncbi:MAG TPA: hypothetical protein VFV95_18215 [Vicinamibacterales bacterium]|nr:hypothetical protein [Vicinamibacterales bacterium]
MLLYVAGVIRFDLAYLCVLVSVLCQAVFVVSAWKTFCALKNWDFSVYRSDTPTGGLASSGAGDVLTEMR